MDYRGFRLSPNIDDRRDEYSSGDVIGRLIETLASANPMMARAADVQQAPLTAIGAQAGILDLDRAQYMDQAKAQLAQLLQQRAMRMARR
jgi:hypothetical protein